MAKCGHEWKSKQGCEKFIVANLSTLLQYLETFFNKTVTDKTSDFLSVIGDFYAHM